MLPAAVYVRISSDVAGEGLGVARQEEDCRALADRRGWDVAEVFSDNDISAYSGKARPGYQRLLEAVRSRRVRAVIAWHPDRLHRSPLELEGFIDVVEETGCQVETVRAGVLDLSTPTGRMTARIVGAVARGESEHKSDRIRRKLAQNATAGKGHGGSRPYGWQAEDRRRLEPAEAEVVRRATELVLAGTSLKAVVRALNESGATTSTGKPWRDVTVRDMLLRPRNAGLRVHHGEVAGTGDWEPILDEETWQSVRRVLIDPSRRTVPTQAGRRHLLSGIATCGVCGGPLRVAKGKAYKGKAKTIYRCQSRGCVTRDQARLDDFITAVVCERLSRPDAAELLRRPDDPTARDATEMAQRLRRQLDDAAAGFAEGALTIEQLKTITARLRPQVEEQERIAAAARPQSLALVRLATADDVSARWAELDLAQRRAVVLELLAAVVVLPARRRGHGGFEPRDVRVEWAT